MMKINSIYFSLLAVAALSACSADEDSAVPAIAIDDTPVEVRLSVGGGSNTRSSVESDENGLFDLDGLGIFMLATHKTSTNPEEKELNWGYWNDDPNGHPDEDEPDSPYTNPWSVWIDNVEANAVRNVDVVPNRTDIRWVDQTTQRWMWYPVGNWYSYRFYGYYPRVEAEDLTSTETQRIVSYTGLDGTTDIIWGRSLGADMSDPNEKYRYSARYFRQSGYGDKSASIAFEHKLMRLQFCIQGISDPNKEPGHEYDDANTMFIDTIIIKQVPTTAQMIVADRDDESNDGAITFDWNNNLANLGVIGANDGEFIKEQVNNDDIIPVGQPILLPVPVDEGFKYRIKIRLSDLPGDPSHLFDHEKPIDLRLNLNRTDHDPNSTLFYESGKTYRVILQIAGPKRVTLSATLAPWDPDTDNSGQDTVEPLVFD